MTDPHPPQPGETPTNGLYVAVGLIALAAIVFAVLVLTSGVLAS